MYVMDYPGLVSVLAFVLMVLAALIGNHYRNKSRALTDEEREYFTIVLSANLTLLGLLIGFSFSMAINRYEQRKNYEEAEANAISTEYVRADMLPAADAARVKALLKKYTAERILFYTSTSQETLVKVWANRSELQAQLWTAILPGVEANPTPVMAVVASGMNDVINSQGYTQASWWNRIPIAAWGFMILIAGFCNLMIGYGARGSHRRTLAILPVAISISFLLIADIDSPRRGIMRVHPLNLSSFLQSVSPNAPQSH
jgi:hypothetical protein